MSFFDKLRKSLAVLTDQSESTEQPKSAPKKKKKDIPFDVLKARDVRDFASFQIVQASRLTGKIREALEHRNKSLKAHFSTEVAD